MRNNGLKGFSLHSTDANAAPAINAVGAELMAASAGGATFAPTSMDPESAARQFLNQALRSQEVPGFTLAGRTSDDTEFRSLGTDASPLTRSTIVKFRQFYRKVPVYGSLVTVDWASETSSWASTLHWESLKTWMWWRPFPQPKRSSLQAGARKR